MSQKKHPHARTQERFKYRNEAVMQGGILGIDKLVLITMCEFAHDDGILYHGIRSLAAATGLKKDQVARSIKRLCKLYGVVLLIEKGRGRRHASRYKILIGAMPEITVYDLVKAKNRKENEKNAAQASHTETVENRLSSETVAGSSVSPARQSNSTVSLRDSSEANRLTRGTKDVDVVSKMLTQVEEVHVNTLADTDAPHSLASREKQVKTGTGSVSKSKTTATPPRNAPCSRCKGPTYGSSTVELGLPFCQECMTLPEYRRHPDPAIKIVEEDLDAPSLAPREEKRKSKSSTEFASKSKPEPLCGCGEPATHRYDFPGVFLNMPICGPCADNARINPANRHRAMKFYDAPKDIQSDDPSKPGYVRPL